MGPVLFLQGRTAAQVRSRQRHLHFFLTQERLQITQAQRPQELQESKRRVRVSLGALLSQIIFMVFSEASEVPQNPAFWGLLIMLESQNQE